MELPSAITREAVMAELAAQLPDSDGLRDDEFTSNQFAQFIGCKPAKATRILDGMIKEGKCTQRSTVYQGKRCWAYKKVEEET